MEFNGVQRKRYHRRTLFLFEAFLDLRLIILSFSPKIKEELKESQVDYGITIFRNRRRCPCKT